MRPICPTGSRPRRKGREPLRQHRPRGPARSAADCSYSWPQQFCQQGTGIGATWDALTACHLAPGRSWYWEQLARSHRVGRYLRSQSSRMSMSRLGLESPGLRLLIITDADRLAARHGERVDDDWRRKSSYVRSASPDISALSQDAAWQESATNPAESPGPKRAPGVGHMVSGATNRCLLDTPFDRCCLVLVEDGRIDVDQVVQPASLSWRDGTT